LRASAIKAALQISRVRIGKIDHAVRRRHQQRIAVPISTRIADRSGRSRQGQRILEAPVLPLLLSLAAPNIGEAAARITFLTADALFVSWLGSDALAGVAVVFPLFLILQTATASGFGSGVSSAIGRALGAGARGRAASLAGVAVAIALIGGALTTALMLAVGPTLYAAMGLTGRPVEMAVLYGAVMFGGSVLVWLMNLLANVSRGAGNMMVPAFAIAIGEAFHLALSPALILGWGPFPALGIVGAALAAVVAYGVGTLVLLVHLLSRQALVRLRLGAIRLRRDEATAILGVGVVSAASATTITASAGVISLAMSPITNSTSVDIALNNVSSYFDGPTVVQGTSGTWFASGTITATDTGGTAVINCKLWDGTTTIASATEFVSAATATVAISLSGFLTNPASNIKMSAKDSSRTGTPSWRSPPMRRAAALIVASSGC